MLQAARRAPPLRLEAIMRSTFRHRRSACCPTVVDLLMRFRSGRPARRAVLARPAPRPPSRPGGARAALGERRAAIDRYLQAFEAGGLPESTCAYRLTELEQQVQALAARIAALEAECDTAPLMATDEVLIDVRRRVERVE
jgi:hypothetical protein